MTIRSESDSRPTTFADARFVVLLHDHRTFGISDGEPRQLLNPATDITHNPVTSLQHPDWTSVFDYEPAQAIKSRKAILDRVATDRFMAMGYHFPFPAIGHVVRHGSAYHWEGARWAW